MLQSTVPAPYMCRCNVDVAWGSEKLRDLLQISYLLGGERDTEHDTVTELGTGYALAHANASLRPDSREALPRFMDGDGAPKPW